MNIPQNVKDWNAAHPTPEQLRAENERLKADNSRLQSLLHPTQRKILADLEAKNARLEAVCALAYEKLSWIREHVEFKDSMNVAIIELGKAAESNVLSDFLAPTLTALEAAKELFDQCAVYERRTDSTVQRFLFGDAAELVDKELSRLLGILGK